MSTNRAFITLAAVASVLAAGCAPVIVIATPDRNNPYDPVSSVVVNMTTNFKPAEAWYVDLDGTNLTGLSPAPVPGGTSSQGIAISTAGPHKVTAQGTCGTFCSYQSDVVTFTPPALMYNSISYVGVNQDLVHNAPATTVYVGVQNFRSVPINVTIQELDGPPFHVKLSKPGGPVASPGAPITVQIPASNTKADFLIEGDVLGLYRLGFTSPGSVSGVGAGFVK